MKKLWEKKGDLGKAYLYYQEEVKMRDSLQNAENYKATQKQQARYEYEKKASADSISNAKAMEIKDLDLARQKAEGQRQQVIIYSFFVGFCIILVFAIIIFRMFIQKKKANILLAEQKQKIEIQNHTLQQANEEINAQKEEIESQRDLVVKQKDHIEEIHKEVTDSINYAERIQRSFMATKSILDENLNDYFVLFRPKDVVSGDFYWAGKLKNNNFALVTADSTGHGVPGAIMSILNISSIEKAVENGICEPAEIFNLTRKNIIERLKNDGSVEGGKDGMDASILVFENNNLFKYSAANNPIWIIRNTELRELQPDKMPLGKHDKDHISFTQNVFVFQKGDIIYTLTDGYPDQFGGPKNKKFLSKNLKQLLLDNSDKPMNEQKEILEKTLVKWIGAGEQIDDITLLGIRL
jgi:serine phosphatase RsbU (regulator of sigma subunit)